jgi:hypothetical protein
MPQFLGRLDKLGLNATQVKIVIIPEPVAGSGQIEHIFSFGLFFTGKVGNKAWLAPSHP